MQQYRWLTYSAVHFGAFRNNPGATDLHGWTHGLHICTFTPSYDIFIFIATILRPLVASYVALCHSTVCPIKYANEFFFYGFARVKLHYLVDLWSQFT